MRRSRASMGCCWPEARMSIRVVTPKVRTRPLSISSRNATSSRLVSLVQDIPSQVQGALEHRWQVPPHQPYDLAHEIWIEKDSALARLMNDRLNGVDTCDVNSRHHQAVKNL